MRRGAGSRAGGDNRDNVDALKKHVREAHDVSLGQQAGYARTRGARLDKCKLLQWHGTSNHVLHLPKLEAGVDIEKRRRVPKLFPSSSGQKSRVLYCPTTCEFVIHICTAGRGGNSDGETRTSLHAKRSSSRVHGQSRSDELFRTCIGRV